MEAQVQAGPRAKNLKMHQRDVDRLQCDSEAISNDGESKQNKQEEPQAKEVAEEVALSNVSMSRCDR